MVDPAKRVEEVAQHVQVPWDARRQRRVERAIVAQQARARRVRAAVAGTAAVAAAVGLGVLLWPRAQAPQSRHVPGPDQRVEQHAGVPRVVPLPPTGGTATKSDPQPVARARDGAAVLRTRDGSTLVALQPETRLAIVEDTVERTVVALANGEAHFDVTPRPERHFEVRIADVRVQVLGTAFQVKRGPRRVFVRVERGRVRVVSPDREVNLMAGDSTSIDIGSARGGQPQGTPPRGTPKASGRQPGERSGPPEQRGTAAPVAPRTRAQPSVTARRWEAVAQDGDYGRAYRMMERAPPVGDAPQELLLAADVARLSGHPGRAVPYLERFLARHSGDPRAALAAFTLGRVNLHELGRPARAASAFARARQLDRDGELAEDALAREVESWSRAGRAEQAAARAQDYVARYPNGRRIHMVKKHGGLP